MARVEAADCRELGVNRRDERIIAIEIAGFAGPIGLVAQIVGDGGGPALGVDPLDEPRAVEAAQEIAQDIEFELRSRKALDAGLAGEERRFEACHDCGAHALAARKPRNQPGSDGNKAVIFH